MTSRLRAGDGSTSCTNVAIKYDTLVVVKCNRSSDRQLSMQTLVSALSAAVERRGTGVETVRKHPRHGYMKIMHIINRFRMERWRGLDSSCRFSGSRHSSDNKAFCHQPSCITRIVVVIASTLSCTPGQKGVDPCKESY